MCVVFLNNYSNKYDKIDTSQLNRSVEYSPHVHRAREEIKKK